MARLLLAPLLLLLLVAIAQAQAADQQEAGSIAAAGDPVMSDERVVFQTAHGDIEFGFWPEVGVVVCVCDGAHCNADRSARSCAGSRRWGQ